MANNPYDQFEVDEEATPLKPSQPEALHGDRGEPTTKAPKKKKTGVLIAVVAIIIGTIVALGFVVMFAIRALSAGDADAEVVPEDPALTATSTTGPSLGAYQQRIAEDLEKRKLREEAERRAQDVAMVLEKTQEPQPTAPAAPSLGQYSGQGQGDQSRQVDRNGKAEPTPAELAALRRFEDDVLWNGGDSDMGSSSAGSSQQQGSRSANRTLEERMAQNPYAAAAGGGQGGGSTLMGSSSGSSTGAIGEMLATETYADGTAYIRPDLKFLLVNGTTIPCTLLPRIVTSYPGQTSCLINRDVYSADGSVVLISRGSKVNGERKVSLQQGVAKVFVSWGSVETPDGVRVRMDSMAADQLGGAGLDAWIDNHYAQRFGGAILLSFIDDALQALADQASSNDGVTFDSSTNNAEDMASTALENSINIPPTGYVTQATETNIIVARDIDFRSVYGVQ